MDDRTYTLTLAFPDEPVRTRTVAHHELPVVLRELNDWAVPAGGEVTVAERAGSAARLAQAA